jgi:acyl dehydratase
MVERVAPRSAWVDAWQPMVDAVGHDFGTGVTVGPDVVERGALRRYVEVLELDCPLHHDPAVARLHRYADVVAPVSSLVSFTIQPLWRPGGEPTFTDPEPDAQPRTTSLGPRRTGLEPPTTAYFGTGFAADYLAPVVAGDQLSRVGQRLVACTPKQTRVGRGAFTTWESEIRNQCGATVALLRTSGYLYVPDASSPAGARPPAATVPVTSSTVAVPSESPIDWDEQRFWDDLHAGQAVGAVAFPLSIYRLIVAAGANRDFNSIHHNRAWARSTGAPDMYANTTFLQGMWERCVRQFIGLAGVIRSVDGFRMTSFNTVGDTVVVSGIVRRTWLEAGVGLAELEIRSENRHGVSVGPGRVVVSLPRR